MIAELFYPKELKNLIATLRDKGQLNENTLDVMNTFINKRMALYVSLAFPMFAIGLFLPEWEARVFLFFLGGIFIYSFFKETRTFLTTYPILYATGHHVLGEVIEDYLSGNARVIAPSGWGLKYKYVFQGTTHKTDTKEITKWIRRTKYNSGDKIPIFVDPQNPTKSVPLTPALKTLCFLTKESNS